MVKFDLKGVFKATAKGRTYWYAWRGPPLGPRLRGEPGSPGVSRELRRGARSAARARRRAASARWSSPTRRAPTTRSSRPDTQQKWGPWLDRIAEHFGELRIAQFERPEKIRPIIRQWRNQWADKPRTADYALAGPDARPGACRRSARQARGQPMRRHQVALPATTGPRSSGPRRTSPRSRRGARPRSATRSIWPRIPACGSATLSACPGRMSGERRDHDHDQQEQASRRGDHPAL